MKRFPLFMSCPNPQYIDIYVKKQIYQFLLTLYLTGCDTPVVIIYFSLLTHMHLQMDQTDPLWFRKPTIKSDAALLPVHS